jgi:dipeptidyl-peptidase-4
MKKFMTVWWILWIVAFVIGQSGQNLNWTLKDAVFHYEKFLGKRPLNLELIPKSNEYSLVYTKEKEIRIFSLKSGKRTRTIPFAEIKRIIASVVDSGSFSYPSGMKWFKPYVLDFWKQDTLLRVDWEKRKAQILFALPEGVTKKFISPGKRYIVFVKQYNLYLMDRKGKLTQVTTDGSYDIQYGSDVHRREFGISTSDGVFWAPDENMFAFYKKDQSMVTDYPYFQYQERPMSIKLQKYPMAGMKNHLVQIGIYNLNDRSVQYLNTGKEADVYLTSVSWTSDSRYILLARVNRDQNHVDVMRFDRKHGWEPAILFSEEDHEWTEPYASIHPLKKKSAYFVWHFYRDGFRNLMLYNVNGKLIEPVTNFKFDVTQFYGEDRTGKILFFQTTGVNPLNRRLYSFNLETGQLKQLTTREGTYSLILHPTGRIHLVTYTSLSVPYILYSAPEGRPKRVLYKSENPFEETGAPKNKIVTLKSNDGCHLYGLLIIPPNISADKKYPVLIYVYGGPHSQMVRNVWLGLPHPWLYYLASRGYVIWVMDNHGTYNRGEHFEQAIFRNLGTRELQDQLKGVKYIRSLSFVDTNRIGVHGWSYGGFMTLTLMTRAPEYFKVGIAGAPVVDWKYYETVYTERYMDSPEQNPEGYENASVLRHIQNLKGHLLVIHGTSDETVVWQHTILLINQAIDKNVQMDYFIFPGHKHGIRGKDRLYLYEKMTKYLNLWLK